MTTRKLGNSGLEIPALVFGGNVFGWTADESTSFRLLDALLDAGLNCIDTADVYSRWVPGHQGGESETLIGKWLKRTGKRDRMVIASKVGMDMGNGHKGLSAAYIEQALGARYDACRPTTWTSTSRTPTIPTPTWRKPFPPMAN